MGRHAKFFGDETGFADPTGFDDPPARGARETQPNVVPPFEPSARSRRRMSWIGRTPLMPLLAGIAATGVIAAAFSTRQISLNFAGKSPAIEEAKIPRNDDVRPSRSAARSPLTVRFRVAGLPSGGFTGTVTIRNTTAKALPKWRLAFQIPNAAVVSVVGAAVRTDGKNGTVVLLGSNVALPPGRFTTVRFKATGATGQPTACKINKLTCA